MRKARSVNPSRTQLLQRLARVKLLSLDVDGVLTDGGLYFTDDGHQFRKFNVKDGMGMQRVRDAGIEVAVVSAGSSSAVGERAKSLGIQHVFIGVADKLAAISGLCRDLGIALDDVVHVGDDLNDVPLLNAVGCPISVSDGVSEVRQTAVFITERQGGDGAVREICDLLLVSRAGAE